MLDKIGIAATSLCALHCILLPILLPALPLLGLTFFADHTWENVFLVLTAILGSIALFSGFKRYHRKMYPFYLLFIGVGIYSQKHSFTPELEPFLIIGGATLIVIAHIVNLRLCESCKQCTAETCSS